MRRTISDCCAIAAVPPDRRHRRVAAAAQHAAAAAAGAHPQRAKPPPPRAAAPPRARRTRLKATLLPPSHTRRHTPPVLGKNADSSQDAENTPRKQQRNAAMMPASLTALRRVVAAITLIVAAAACSTATATCPMMARGSRGLGMLPKQAPWSRAAVEAVDWPGLKADLLRLMSASQADWPTDFSDAAAAQAGAPQGGTYAGMFVRQAWHCSGSYRAWDGRGGCEGGRQRFAPEFAWPDNTNLDKAKQVLRPLKEKYGDGLSWGDLIILAGNVAIESTGGPSLGFCAGRVDDADGTASLPLGPTPEQRAIAPCVAGDGDCESPLGQTTMGLIYVNPAGVMGEPVPEKSVEHIRRTFGQMGMNDSETVALIGGGHAIGKTHGACPAGAGPGPDEAPDHPWPGLCGDGPTKGKGPNAFTSGFEGSWTAVPWRWSNDFYTNLLAFDWEVETSPGGQPQWAPRAKPAPSASASASAAADAAANDDAVPNVRMLTTDVALLHDPSYLSWVQKYAADDALFDAAFAAAWYKLTTRDQGPVTRCLNVGDGDGWLPPAQPFQRPLPPPPPPSAQPDWAAVRADIEALLPGTPAPSSSSSAAASALAPDVDGLGAWLATLAWQCASTFRATDNAGGCNGARIAWEWEANAGLRDALAVLAPLQEKHGAGLTTADLIVLAGSVALERGAGSDAAGFSVPFCPGRSDDTDEASKAPPAFLAPRSYVNTTVAVRDTWAVMGLTPAEGVALAARPRSVAQQRLRGYSGAWSPDAPSRLSNAYYNVLLGSTWQASRSPAGKDEFVAAATAGSGSSGGSSELYMTPEDLVIRAEPDLRELASRYAADRGAWLNAFAAAWAKVMDADRFAGPAGNECVSGRSGGDSAAPDAAVAVV